MATGPNKLNNINAAKSSKVSKGKKGKGKFKLAYTNRKTTKLLSESGNNELSKEDLSYLTEDEKLLLSSWDLPSTVLAKYRAKGITTLFKWQLDCLANENVLKGRNLVYSAPTSAGKTLVAEILMMKRVLELGRKAIMILPFVAVAREKMYSLQELYGDCGIRVEGFMGSYNPPGGFKAVDIAICTIEKANSLINRLLEEGSLSQLGTIVVDELHLLGDPHRGYLLELLLTKVRFMTSRPLSISKSADQSETSIAGKLNNLSIQIIGMSATLPNLELLAVWLNAELVITQFRPVPLVERIKMGDKIYDPLLTPVRDVYRESLPIRIPNDQDDVVYLTLETISEGHSLLIFCPTKKMCEQLAEQIAREFYTIGNPASNLAPVVGEMLRNQLNGDKISEIITQLSQCPGGMDDILGKCVSFGVAFHHAGLTYDERDIVESGFKRGVIRVIVATSTLSAGVNLPARRVIIITPNFNGGMLDVLTYRQMSGRAGRQGIDTEGESILVCPAASQRVGVQLVQSSLPAVTSALIGQRGFLTSCMKRAIIEVISSGIATSPSQVQEYSKCTLLSHTIDVEEGTKNDEELSCSQHEMDVILEECVQFLIDNDFIRLSKYEDPSRPDEYTSTQLGCACLASSLSPDEGIVVFKELEKARRCFVLENELHVIYQVTPIYVADQWRNIDWNQFLSVWQDLTLHERKVAELVGVEESFILRAMVGIVSRRNPKQASQLAIHQRFFTALALNDLVNEMPIGDVAEKYSVNKGVVQNLQQSASTFAGMVTVFCSRLGWSNLELLLSQFQERLQFGVQRELCDLVRLSLLNGQRARILYDAGIKTIADLAGTEPSVVEQHLHKAGPFSSVAHGQTSKSVWMLGKKDGLSEKEAAQQIVEEARTFLQIELGLPENVVFYKLSPEKEKPRTLEMLSPNKSKIINLSSRSILNLKESEKSISISNNSSRNHSTPNRNSPSSTNSNKMVELSTNAQHEISSRIWADISVENFFDESFTAISGNFDTKVTSTRRDSLETGDPGAEKSGVVLNDELVFPEMTKNSLLETGKGSRDFVGHAKPIKSVSDQSEVLSQLRSESIPKTESLVQNIDLCEKNDHDILMSSIVNMMETSLQVSWNGENEVSSAEVKVQAPNSRTTEEQKEDMIGFSEDMFPDEEIPENVINSAVDKHCSSSSNEVLNTSFEADEQQQSRPIHSTPRPSIKRVRMSKNELDEQFDKFGSSGEFELNRIRKPLCDSLECLESVRDLGNGLKLKIVEDPSYLPDHLFNRSNSLGIGLRLNYQKRFSSTPRSAIGNKIVGKRLSHSSQRPQKSGKSKSEDEDDFAIGLFNGFSKTIWCYRWKHDNEQGRTLRSGLSCLSTNNRSKVANLFQRICRQEVPIVITDAKRKLKALSKYCGKYLPFDQMPQIIYDPRIANWLIHSDDNKFMSLHEMVDSLLDNSDRSLLLSDFCKDIIDSYLNWKIMSVLKDKLIELKIWKHFVEVEMPSIRPFILMEMNGLGMDNSELERLKRILEFEATVFELRAYQIAGRQFNLNSAKDIRQVLYREIGLTQPDKTKATGKDVLKKIDHELPGLIIEWRKITCALKTLIPFLHGRDFDTGRVHGHYSHFTSSGRVIMSEPSLQLIPRDFNIKSTLNTIELEKLRHDCKIKFGLKFTTLLSRLENHTSFWKESERNSMISISMRNAFVPSSESFVLLSADYCQLELRILAHLCQDDKLTKILQQSSGDVFKRIAAQLNHVNHEMVSEEQRQEAKAITYGIIYGMGAKTLSEQLEVEESYAIQYISQFMKTYPKIRAFIDKSIEFCRQNGYVETLSGRRRYLEHINSRNIAERAQAERQAVNSRIQGSASDLVKSAMIRIQTRLASIYPQSLNPVQWTTPGSSFSKCVPNVLNTPYFPVLNLHDELMFEVNKSFLPQIAKEIKIQMESCLDLNVIIPVVVKTGFTWGKLTPYEVV